ncbi:NUDIX hydrolase [Planococcus sp. FY231025]|uniref:NUDIX hydrolase n=1 Tax=Planococcus sp. FY231025 TaxID=3455699 RepID=UPI003F93B7F0
MERVDVVYVYLSNKTEDQVLMVKNFGAGDSYYTLPGGAVEKGETLEEAAIREAKEETGLDVSIGGILSVSEKFFEDRNHHAVFFTFIGEVVGGHLEIAFPEEIEEVVWMDIEMAKDYTFLGKQQGQGPTIPYILHRQTVRNASRFN